MPRKKKEEKVIEQPINNSPIGYKGEVNIKVVRNGKIIKRVSHKNEGTSQMFYFLAKCLQGSYEENLRPKYIHLFNNDSGTSSQVTSLATMASRSYLVQKSGDYGASLEFVIPAIYINVDKPVNELRLYNSIYVTSADENSAVVMLKSGDEIEVNPDEKVDTSILITWTLYLSNTGASSETSVE